MATSVFYSIISNFNYFRPKGCWFFCPVSCVLLLHMGHGVRNNHFANLAEFGKPLETAGDQWVKHTDKQKFPRSTNFNQNSLFSKNKTFCKGG